MTTTYCTYEDIVGIIGEAALIASIDDDHNYVLSVEDEAQITRAIEWGAVEINRHIRHQYKSADIDATNTWLIWANAELAVYRLRSRRNNPVEPSNDDNYTEIKRILNEIRWGREQIPDHLPSHDHLPSVSNFRVQMGRTTMPVRVHEEESTTTPPPGNRKRFTTDNPGGY